MAKSVKLTMLTGLDTGITWKISENISRSLISLYSEQCIYDIWYMIYLAESCFWKDVAGVIGCEITSLSSVPLLRSKATIITARAQMQPPICTCKSSLVPKIVIALWLSMQEHECNHPTATANHPCCLNCSYQVFVIRSLCLFFFIGLEFALWLSLQSPNCTHISATANHSFSIVIIIDVACMLQKTCLTSSTSSTPTGLLGKKELRVWNTSVRSTYTLLVCRQRWLLVAWQLGWKSEQVRSHKLNKLNKRLHKCAQC